MSFNLVTGRKATEHVTSTQFRNIIRALAGNDTYIPEVDEKLEIEHTSSTSITVHSGVLIHHGCVFEIPYGDGVSFTIDTPQAGVEKYYGIAVIWEISGGIESARIICMDRSSGDYPGTQGNMQEGDTFDSVEIARVHVDGLNVSILQIAAWASEMEIVSNREVPIPMTGINAEPVYGAVLELLSGGYYVMQGYVVFQAAESQYLSQAREMQIAIYYLPGDGSIEIVWQSMVRISAPTGKYAKLQTTAIGYLPAGAYEIGATCTTPCSADCDTQLRVMRIR